MISDNTPAAFKEVHRDERARLKLSHNLTQLDGVGLALSGGGIRSASFALGVVQVLLNENLFRKIDYISTVSGGGYLGSAISWWLHLAATNMEFTATHATPTHFEAFRQQFGSKVTGARTVSPEDAWSGSNWLAYIRQHGNYLQPRGVGYASLAASVLRVCLYSLCVYSLALVGLFCLILRLESRWNMPHGLEYGSFVLAAVATVALVVISWIYGPATWFASWLSNKLSSGLYEQRTRFRNWSGGLLSVGLAAMVISSVPALYLWLDTPLSAWRARGASLSFLSLGTLGTIYQFLKGRAQSKTKSWIGPVRVFATAALVIYGLLLGSYAVAWIMPHPATWGIACLTFSAFFGLLVNLNYAGLARLYRDRLMEAFLPNLKSVAENKWTLATQADTYRVKELKGRLERDGHLVCAAMPGCQRPLHIINCNAVLMDSPRDLYRNRGGDNFFISQLWSGSNATGWVDTKMLGDGAMTLATAMSISGAAANPNAAPNGLGVTRNRLVSFLMSLFNVRLGYWMANPKCGHAKPSNKPNLWFPGFMQGLLGSGLSEDASFLELTDGGHFDNTAVYELIRRRTKLIIVAQAGCDPNFTMEDIANAIEKVRVDFSVFIEFGDHTYGLDALRAAGTERYQPCKRGFAIGRIRYPKGTPTSPDFDDGYLVYLQAVPTSSVPADIASYWRRHAQFPNDSTSDQFFTEENLEAYRELGYAIATEFCREFNGSAEGPPELTALRASLFDKKRPTSDASSQLA